jgi:dihydropteroate synthase
MYLYRVSDPRELASTILRIGADPGSIPFFNAKSGIIFIFVSNVDTRAANALKQEMLSRGGDVIVHRNSIDRQIDITDIVIMGTRKQFDLLISKLEYMPYWGLDDVRKDLEKVISSCFRNKWSLALPGGTSLELGKRTLIMGILNLTTDSFYEKSRIGSGKHLLDSAQKMVEEGAHILDVGAESTRPGAENLPLEVERERVIPAVRSLIKAFPDTIISVDTYKSEIAKEAASEGAHIINDISGMTYDPLMAGVIAASGAAVVINHVRGTPADMQNSPFYEDILGEITDHLRKRIENAERAGISRHKMVIDPGIGFGKTMDHNFLILKNLPTFRTLGLPILIGHSRKSFLGSIPGGGGPEERLEGTLAVSALCAWEDIQIIRVHDVRENRRIIDTIQRVKEAQL